MMMDLWRNTRTPRSLAHTWDSIAREFDDFLGEFDSAITNRTGSTASLMTTACDVQENEKAYLMSFDVPGFKKEDISIEISGSTLTVSGKRQREEKVEEGKYHRIERQFGEFRRVFTLPDKVKAEAIEANYENGVLYLGLPKQEVSKTKKVEIGEAKPGFIKKLVGLKSDEEKKAVNEK